MEDFKPAQIHTIKDLEAAKAIADPLRLQIIEVLLHNPLTVKQIARKSNISEFDTAKIFYGMISSGLVRAVTPKTEKTERKKEPRKPQPQKIEETKDEGWLSKFFKKI